MSIHIRPSYYVKRTTNYHLWTNVTECPECGLRAHYKDCHPVEPCPNCGGKLKEKVGKWVITTMAIPFFRKEKGTWVLRDEVDKKECL